LAQGKHRIVAKLQSAVTRNHGHGEDYGNQTLEISHFDGNPACCIGSPGWCHISLSWIFK